MEKKDVNLRSAYSINILMTNFLDIDFAIKTMDKKLLCFNLFEVILKREYTTYKINTNMFLQYKINQNTILLLSLKN